MESVVLLGLMGVGYLMNKDEKQNTYPEVEPPLFEGSGNSGFPVLRLLLTVPQIGTSP